MPQPILRTERLLLVPLAGRHLELEVQLDSDPEVLRFISGRARSRDEVLASHTQRMALASRVDGLGFWMAFGSDGGAADWTPPASEEESEFIGLMMLPPAHGPDQPDDPTVTDLGYRLLRRYWGKGLASEGVPRLATARVRNCRAEPSYRADHGREHGVSPRDGGDWHAPTPGPWRRRRTALRGWRR
jgi:RimJ/RimL family protein N-acetyltransferase